MLNCTFTLTVGRTGTQFAKYIEFPAAPAFGGNCNEAVPNGRYRTYLMSAVCLHTCAHLSLSLTH